MSSGFQMGLLCMSGARIILRVKNKDVYVAMSEPSRQEVSLFSGQSQSPSYGLSPCLAWIPFFSAECGNMINGDAAVCCTSHCDKQSSAGVLVQCAREHVAVIVG